MYIDSKAPTYGELIDILVETELQNSSDVADNLVLKFRKLYPDIYIGRPSRFLDTVRKIAAPTFFRGENLKGAKLMAYRNNRWLPRIRNFSAIGKNNYKYNIEASTHLLISSRIL